VNDQRQPLLRAAALASLQSKPTAPVPELERRAEVLELLLRGVVIRQDSRLARVVSDVQESIVCVRGAASADEQQEHDGGPRALATIQAPPR
jgi:hypothetical protein